VVFNFVAISCPSCRSRDSLYVGHWDSPGPDSPDRAELRCNRCGQEWWFQVEIDEIAS
jgi:DNA-directed RNA polymerase subunit RPC12/RpoP